MRVDSRRHLHPALAVLVALALHAGVGLGLRWVSRQAATPQATTRQAALDVDAEIELAIIDDGPLALPQAAHADSFSPVAALESVPAQHRKAVPAGQGAAIFPAPDTTELADPAASDSAAPELPASSSGSAPPRGIDLGLNDGVRRAALLGGWVELPSRPSRPSDGGLRQGLAALDAERGLSGASAAQHTAYAAARRFAPPTGIGIFDVTADERGVVLTVTLASAPAHEAEWQRVAGELQQLLKERRLRVPPGAKGLAARLRIETGELAKNITERFRSPRGPALGQAPVHPREMRAESTRSSLEPGQLSPTLGVTIAGGGNSASIRVVLLDERPL